MPNLFFISFSLMFGSKNNNIIQLGSILINEANVLLESFFQIFLHGSHVKFFKKLSIPKINKIN
jgi:hypothetical protein